MDKELEAARQGLRTVLRQMAGGADDELTIQVLIALRGIDDGQDVPETWEQQVAVAQAQLLAGKLAEVI